MERSSSSQSDFATQFERERQREKMTRKEKKADKKEQNREEKARKKADAEAKCLAEVKQMLTKVTNKEINSPSGDPDAPCTMPSTMDTDAELLRFVVARKADPQKTFDMVVACAKWRNTFKPDQLEYNSFRREAEAGKAFLLGPDKTGHLTWLIFTGRHNPKQSENEEVIRCMAHYLEDTRKKLPAGITEMNIILDFEGWTPGKNVDQNLDKMMFQHLQDYYPEVLHTAYVLHPPAVFKVAWAVIRPWLDKRTQNKIHMLPASQVSETLLRDFDASVIPKKYGGTNDIKLDPGTPIGGEGGAPAALTMQR